MFRKSEILIGSMVSFGDAFAKSDEIKADGIAFCQRAARISTTMAMRNLSSIGGVLMIRYFHAEVVLVLSIGCASRFCCKITGRKLEFL